MIVLLAIKQRLIQTWMTFNYFAVFHFSRIRMFRFLYYTTHNMFLKIKCIKLYFKAAFLLYYEASNFICSPRGTFVAFNLGKSSYITSGKEEGGGGAD